MTDEAKQLIEYAALLDRCIELQDELACRLEPELKTYHDYMIPGSRPVTCGLCGSPASACCCDVAAFDAALRSIQAQARLCPHCGQPMEASVPAGAVPFVDADEQQTWREREKML